MARNTDYSRKREETRKRIQEALALSNPARLFQQPRSSSQINVPAPSPAPLSAPLATLPLSGQAHAASGAPEASPRVSAGQGAEPVTAEDAARQWIIQRESGWKPTAKNPNSSAFGLGQMIRANRVAYGEQLGIDPDTTDAAEQLRLADAYVRDRYGSWVNAKKFWEQHKWY